MHLWMYVCIGCPMPMADLWVGSEGVGSFQEQALYSKLAEQGRKRQARRSSSSDDDWPLVCKWRETELSSSM